MSADSLSGENTDDTTNSHHSSSSHNDVEIITVEAFDDEDSTNPQGAPQVSQEVCAHVADNSHAGYDDPPLPNGSNSSSDNRTGNETDDDTDGDIDSDNNANPSSHGAVISTTNTSASSTIPHSTSNKQHSWKLTESLVMWIALIVAASLHALSEVCKFGGSNTVEMTSRTVSTFTIPSYGHVTAIVMYLALAVWLILSSFISRDHITTSSIPLSTIGVFFICSCLLDIVWVLTWHFGQFSVSIAASVLMVASSIALYLSVRHKKSTFLHTAPIGIMIGWSSVVCALTIAFVASYYADHQGKAFWQLPLAVVLLAMLFLESYVLRAKGNEWMTGLVVVWSGICAGLSAMDTNKLSAIVIIALTVAGAFFTYIPWKRLLKNSQEQ